MKHICTTQQAGARQVIYFQFTATELILRYVWEMISLRVEEQLDCDGNFAPSASLNE